MDWYPLWNSLRIAAISAVIVFFAGIFAAYYIAKLPRGLKGLLDALLTLPLVLPPTVVGYLLLCLLGPRRPLGAWVLDTFGLRLTMTWWSAIFATTVVIFPLMYRTARGAFEAFDETLADAGRTLLTNARQAQAVQRALESVEAAQQAAAEGITPDAVLTCVEDALYALGELTGANVREDITQRIFERFCVGK